jgi:hypothetical protein
MLIARQALNTSNVLRFEVAIHIESSLRSQAMKTFVVVVSSHFRCLRQAHLFLDNGDQTFIFQYAGVREHCKLAPFCVKHCPSPREFFVFRIKGNLADLLVPLPQVNVTVRMG